MYQINKDTYAIENGDNIKFVRDGGGNLDILAGTEGALKDPETGPRLIESDECIILTIIPAVSF